MKLVAFFVPGDVAAAIDVVNELHLTYEFAQMMPGTAKKMQRLNPFDPLSERSVQVEGHTVFVRLTDQRTHWLKNNLERLGL